jgi:sulfur carrier protein
MEEKMKFKVKLFATLREGRSKIIEMDKPQGMKVIDICNELAIDKKDIAILLINGLDGSLEQEVNDQDTISIFPPVGGG